MKIKAMKYIGIIATIVFATFTAYSAQTPLKVYDINVSINDAATEVDVSILLNLKDFKIGRNSEMVFTPYIISSTGKDSVAMEPVIICGRNRWYEYMRDGLLDQSGGNTYRSGASQTVTIRRTLPFETWMAKSTVEMRQQEATCCGTPKTVPGNSRWGNVLLASINTSKPQLANYDYVFAPSMSDAPVEKSLQGKAFVNFVVNRTELNPDYMINRSEIRKILNSIDIVRNDKDAVITNVHIKGFASPEGPYDNNVRLAKGRTETLAAYVNDLYKFAPGIMTTSYDPEDWAGLRNYITDSLDYRIANRSEILDVIDGPLGFDAKDMALKTRFPQDYEVILKQIYPWLRHSDYTVTYRVKVYTDINELKRLYAEDPTKLRPVDFYLLAKEYPEGSARFFDIMKKAVEVYPDDPMINLNVANYYMLEGDFEAAQSCLLKAGLNPYANFARGVLAAKRGDYREAEKYFNIAREAGIPQASTYLNQIEQTKAYHPVTIEIETTKDKKR